MKSENRVVRRVFERMREDRRLAPWMKRVKEYADELGLTWGRIGEMGSDKTVGAVNEYDCVIWRVELEGKTSLEFYRMKRGYRGSCV